MSADYDPVRRANRTVIVALPDEIDIADADQVRELLLPALADGVTVLVADMTWTRFCACQGCGRCCT